MNSRWSIFSRGVKEEMKQESNNNGGEEVVLSVKEQDQEQEQEQEVKTTVVVESTEDGVGVNKENADADVYEKVNAYLKTRIAKSDGNDSNSHYKGLHTEVMPTMPVLFIEEFDEDLCNFGYKKSKSVSVTDWRAYIYYDSSRDVYVVNGTRRRSDEQGAGIERKFPDIRMTFKSRSSLAFYLQKSMCSLKHKLSVTMYSMYRSVIHLTTCGAMPSFHSIHHCRNKFRTELFGYDDCRVSLKEFESYLKVLKEGSDDGFLFRPTEAFKVNI
jgi:hypothetical protein